MVNQMAKKERVGRVVFKFNTRGSRTIHDRHFDEQRGRLVKSHRFYWRCRNRQCSGRRFSCDFHKERVAINMKRDLARLTRIDLRDVWGHEATDFTNWLAQQENLDLLSEEIGIEIKLIKTEADVGSFRVDILAEEGASGRKIIIENQLEDTNHDHLG